MASPQRPAPAAWLCGFTLIELMLSMVVLTLLMMVSFGVIDAVSKVFKRTRAQNDTFQEARAVYEGLTRRLSQAMLNTYWDYEYPNNNTNLAPTAYVRKSELHMVAGPTKDGAAPLLPDATIQSVTHGVFFQSPLGFSAPATETAGGTTGLANLLNVSGYFVQYTSDKLDRPKFLREGDRIPAERWRLRLMELNQPTEYLRTYKATMNPSKLKPFDWFREPLITASEPTAKRVLAENVIALVLRPHRSPNDPPPAGSPRQLAPNYYYDSRLYVTKPADTVAKLTRNQLPPTVEVTMIAIDETSASRLQDRLKDASVAPLAELGLTGLFARPSTSTTPPAAEEGDLFRTDLKTLEEKLVDLHLTYRTFSTDVSILQAKWSED
jgi:uncharacterized protein (TIGR02599 family)